MPMTAQNRINDKIFDRINTVESKVDGMSGYLKGIVETNKQIIEQNDKLISLIEKRDVSQGRIGWALIALLFFALGVIAFGAIGKEGLYSVRKAMPSRIAAILAPGDLDKWMNARRAL